MNALALIHEAPRFVLKARHMLGWVARHTGIPTLIVAAVAIVATVRVLKRALHLAIEVAVVAVLLLIATKLGWLRW